MRAHLTPPRRAKWMSFTALIAICACTHTRPAANCVAIDYADTVNSSFIVVYKPGVDPVSTTARLAKKHSFTPTAVYRFAIRGFAAKFTEKVLAAVRCEPEVQYIEHDTPGSIVSEAKAS